MSEARKDEKPCLGGCGEMVTASHGRCRECDIEYLMDTWPKCKCGALLLSDAAVGIGMAESHTDNCEGRHE